MTEFQQYLHQLGDEKASRLFGVARRTAQSWRLGERKPRPDQAKAIIDKTPLTYASIYEVAV